MAVRIKETFPPVGAFSYTAVAADASANYVEFKISSKVSNCIGEVLAADGTDNLTGYKQTITYSKGTSTIKIAVTAITVGDVINVVFW